MPETLGCSRVFIAQISRTGEAYSVGLCPALSVDGLTRPVTGTAIAYMADLFTSAC